MKSAIAGLIMKMSRATTPEAIGAIGSAGAVGKRLRLGPECPAVREPVFLSLVKCV
jgi:hypothetical protein